MELFELLDELENKLMSQRGEVDPDSLLMGIYNAKIAVIRQIRDCMDEDE